jgi:hypothetical protein
MEPIRTEPSSELAQSILIITIYLFPAVKWTYKEKSDWFKWVHKYG